MLALWMQYGIHPGPDSLLEPLALIVVVGIVGGLLLVALRFVVGHARGALARRRMQGRRLRAAAGAEARARALMSELCPFGWHAQITIVEGAEPVDAEDRAEGAGSQRVALDWTELSAADGRPAVMRRVWADTVSEALEAMVADRLTDETLEQIEQGAAANGALWPDLP